MNKRLSLAVSLAIVILFSVWTVFFIFKNLDYFKTASRIEWHILIPLFLLSGTNHFLNGLQFRLLAASSQVSLRRVESMAISIVASLINLVSPFRAGVGFRAYYLMRYHALPLDRFVPVMGGHVILGAFVRAVMGLLVVVLLTMRLNTSNTALLVIFTALSLISACVVFFTPSLPGKLKTILATPIDSWERIKQDRSLIRHVSILVVTQVLFAGLILYLAFIAGSITVTYVQALLLAIAGSFGMVFGLTPGGIGIVESIYLVTSPLLGISLENMLMAALIRRAVDMLALFIISPVAWFSLKVSQRKEPCT